MALARAIKADPAIASTRLIILTSLGQRPDDAELAAAGIDAYLVKPVKQSRLFDRLVEVMGHARMQQMVDGTAGATDAARPDASSPPPPARKARVLLAEDNPINQKVALGQLQRLGYSAEAVANGKEVLSALEQIPYDIVLMDCQMPEMDGYEATRTIRRREAGDTPPPARTYIIAMTANAMHGDREMCLAAGMDDYVSKPVRREELQAALDRWRPAAVNPPSPGQSAGPAAPVAIAEPVAPPVDMERLLEMAGDDPGALRELADLYLDQAAELMSSLEAAIRDGSARDLEQVAHKLGGSSSTCGMTGMVLPLREMEHLGRSGYTPKNDRLYSEASRQLALTRDFLDAHIPRSEPEFTEETTR